MGRRLAEEPRVGGRRTRACANKVEAKRDGGRNEAGEEQRPGSGCPRAGGKGERGSRCLKEHSLPLALLVCKLIGPI